MQLYTPPPSHQCKFVWSGTEGTGLFLKQLNGNSAYSSAKMVSTYKHEKCKISLLEVVYTFRCPLS